MIEIKVNMTKKELEAKVINAQSAVAKREAVLAKHRDQLAKLIAKGQVVVKQV